jgi:hypothetical protein
VAPAFNDPSIFPVVFSFNDWADEKGGNLQVEKIPSMRRDGLELKKRYQDCRASFTVSYSKWSRSGQNDPDEVSDLLSFTLRTIPEGMLLDSIASGPVSSENDV